MQRSLGDLGPIETCNSGPKVAVLHAKATNEGGTHRVCSSVVFAFKSATLGPELPSLSGSQPSSVVFAFKTATLAPELQVSKGPSPHLWFLLAKQDFWN